MSVITIERGVKMDEVREFKAHGNTKYPWAEMEVGDSFAIDYQATGLISYQNGKDRNREFKLGMANGGYRIWRVR